MSRLVKDAAKRVLNALPDYAFLDEVEARLAFWVAHHRFPRRGSGFFNDRLFYFKTDPRWTEDPVRQFCSDKHLAKIYIRGVLGREAAPRTLALVERPEDVAEDAFPAPSVIKPTHLQGAFICLDGSNPLGEEGLARIRSWFDARIYRQRARERNYRNLRPRVLAEEMVGHPDELVNWRVFCWQGAARVIQVDRDPRRTNRDPETVSLVRSHYTPDWEFLDIALNAPLGEPEPPPALLDEMIGTAERLAGHFDFVRVDFYIARDRLWVGELTNIPSSAHGRFRSAEEERRLHEIVFGDAMRRPAAPVH